MSDYVSNYDILADMQEDWENLLKARALDNAISFDWNLIGTGDSFHALSDRLSEEVWNHKPEGPLKSVKLTTIKRNMPIILAHLLKAYGQDRSRYASYTRRSNNYSRGSDKQSPSRYRYNPSQTSYKGAVRAADGLCDLGYATHDPGYWDQQKKKGRYSRLRGTQTLFAEFDALGLDASNLSRHRASEMIVLKGEDGKLAAYDDTDATNQMRAVVAAYNDLLNRHEITLSPNYPTSEAETVDLSRKFVWRGFSQNSFEHGGRFYGPWWITCSRGARPHILIDGSPTVELDYRSQFAHIAYSRCGLDYEQVHPEETDPDPYNVSGIPRLLAKWAFLISLNTDSKKQAIRALRDKCANDEDFRQFDRLGVEPEQAIDAVLAKHQAIAELFFQSVGLEFQNIDSRICERNILACLENAIPVLTVHDSFIVKDEHQEWMKAVMRASVEAIYPPSIPTITGS